MVAAAPARRPRTFPWTDRRGKLSWLKASVFALVFVPGIVNLVQYFTGQFTGRPMMELVHGFGFWTIRFLLITLAITPMRRLADWPDIVLVRRMLGVTTMAYALCHLTLYAIDENGRLLFVASEIVHRVYLTIGFIALFMLVVLGITSTDGWVRRMGRDWKQLHRVVYLLAALGTLHFYMQSKANVSEAVMMSGFLLWLLLWRLVPARWQANVAVLLLMAPVVAAGTAAMEYGWYDVATRINPMRVLLANLNLHLASGPRPAVWVLIVALLVAFIPLVQRLAPRKRPAVRRVAVPAGMVSEATAGRNR